MLDVATAVVERLFVGPNPRISPIFACPILKFHFDHASARCVGGFQILGRIFVNLANRHSSPVAVFVVYVSYSPFALVFMLSILEWTIDAV